MNRCLLFLIVVMTLVIAPLSVAAPRTFRDTEGRKIEAELMAVHGDKVTIRRTRDLKVITFSMAKLSEDDRKYAREWQAARDQEAEARRAMTHRERAAVERREKIVAFCAGRLGTQVGNGECWTLANEAFKSSRAKRPGGHLRVWGRQLDLDKEKVEPGDIIEFEAATIRGYGTTAREHTAVVVKQGRRKVVTIAQQNWGGNRTVHEMEVDLDRLVAGKVLVYRPD